MAHTRAHLPSFESSKTLNHTDCHAASVPAASPGGDAGSAGGAAGALAANPPKKHAARGPAASPGGAAGGAGGAAGAFAANPPIFLFYFLPRVTCDASV